MNPEADYAYVTTTGRRTGRAHEIEIWFAAAGDTLYLLSGDGERSDWVRNLIADPRVTVRVESEEVPAKARTVEDPEEDGRARRLLLEKYEPRYRGSLERWGLTATPVALVLEP